MRFNRLCGTVADRLAVAFRNKISFTIVEAQASAAKLRINGVDVHRGVSLWNRFARNKHKLP